MMKPYPGQNLLLPQIIFNYRLSRARRIIENCFGIAGSDRKPIIAKVDKAVQITKAVVVLHNFLMASRSPQDSHNYCHVNYIDEESAAGHQSGQRRSDATVNEWLVSMPTNGSNNYSRSAKEVRDDFKDYFNSPQGAIKLLTGRWTLSVVHQIHTMIDEQQLQK